MAVHDQLMRRRSLWLVKKGLARTRMKTTSLFKWLWRVDSNNREKRDELLEGGHSAMARDACVFAQKIIAYGPSLALQLLSQGQWLYNLTSM